MLNEKLNIDFQNLSESMIQNKNLSNVRNYIKHCERWKVVSMSIDKGEGVCFLFWFVKLNKIRKHNY